MRQIKMVDLFGQYQKIKSEIDSAIQDVIQSSAFINGQPVRQLQFDLKKYLACENVITCANGTDALQIALMAIGANPGDEIIVPDFTFISTAEVCALLKFKPVFVDVDSKNFNIDIQKLKASITPKTKAIIPVHLFGQCANMEEIMSIAADHNLTVIEDNAQAFGSEVLIRGEWKKSGTVGHIGCASFFPSKNLGCFGDGGAIFTNDNVLAEKITAIANHGSRVKYFNDIVGVNSRLDTIQAAVLKVKLERIDEYNRARQNAAKIYDELLHTIAQIQIPERVNYSTHVFHQYTLVVDQREELKEYLYSRKIPTMIYFPRAMHNQKAYKTDGIFNVSTELCDSVLSLPMHTELLPESLEYIAKCIHEFYNKA